MLFEEKEDNNLYKNKVAVIIDDHLLFAESFSGLLKKTKIFEDILIMSDFKEFAQFLFKISKKTKIYLFLDYYLKDDLGVEFIDQSRKLHKKMSVIVVSTVTKLPVIQTILSHFPEAIISKYSGFDVILECIQTVEKGMEYYCPHMRKALNEIQNQEPIIFSKRELELLKLCVKGATIEEAASILILSKHTIVSHRRRMMNRTNTRSITELIEFARQSGVLSD